MNPEQLSEILHQADWLEAQLRQQEAFALLSRGIALERQAPRLYARRAEVLKNVGTSEAALADLEQALSLYADQGAPDPWEYPRTHSRLILLRWSLAERQEDVMAELANYASLHAPPVRSVPLRDPDPERPLRIGYLSPDFRSCSAALLLEMLFLQPQAEGKRYAYSLVAAPADPAQRHFRRLLPHWRDLALTSPAEVAAAIEADGIDVLIDLAGHTSLNGLPALLLQPAPIQVTGLTFNGPLNLPQLPYRFTDALATPMPGDETALTLDSWIWWPEPDALPGRDPDAIPPLATALGCAHHPGRISPACVALWSELLQALPSARLELKHRFYANDWCRQTLTARFAVQGIGSDRLRFLPGSDYTEYLAWYRGLDLVLDPFPYHGGLVSCEAVWMGLPLITLADWMRGGESLLSQLDYPAGIAGDRAEYLAKALLLARSPWLRREAAMQLRTRLQASSIPRPARLSAQVAQSCRQLWRQACDTQSRGAQYAAQP